MTTVTEPEVRKNNANPFDKVILVSLQIKMMGETRQVKTSQIEVNADKTMLSVSKRLFDCAEYKAIRSAAGDIRTYLYRKMVPGGERLFRSGCYPIPIPTLKDVDDTLLEKVKLFDKAVEKFCEVYPVIIRKAMDRLRDLANAKDYPKVEYVKEQFGVTYEYVSIGPPENLKDISKDLYQREMEKIQASCNEAAKDIQLALRTMFQELLDHMVDRLKPGPDGKKKIFKDTLIGNMKEFLTDFQARNITNDEDLAQLVKKCRNILEGKSPDFLRKNEDSRERVAEALDTLKKDVDRMVQMAPKRKIMLDEEE